MSESKVSARLMSKPSESTSRVEGRQVRQAIGARAALATLLATTLLLGACEPEDPSAETTPTSKPARKAPKTADGDMTAAVSAKPGGGLVELGFAVQKRPKVGEPVEIEFAITPSVDLERVFARFQAVEGLQIVSGAETEHLEHPAKGVPVSHTVTIVPKTDGIFYVTAVVLADSDKESVARTFSVPVIAGQGLAELPAAPAAASTVDPKTATATP